MRRLSFVRGIAALGVTAITSIAGVAQTPAIRTFTPERFYNTFSGAHPPALTIKPGERIATRTIYRRLEEERGDDPGADRGLREAPIDEVLAEEDEVVVAPR